jgi:hypothetical protein
MRHHGLQSAVIRRLCPLLPVNRCSYFTHKRRGNTLVWWSLFSGQPLLELVSKTGLADTAWWHFLSTIRLQLQEHCTPAVLSSFSAAVLPRVLPEPSGLLLQRRMRIGGACVHFLCHAGGHALVTSFRIYAGFSR